MSTELILELSAGNFGAANILIDLVNKNEISIIDYLKEKN